LEELGQGKFSGLSGSSEDVFGVDLSGADLSGAILVGEWLEGASLRGARLDEAILVDVFLRVADLSDASLDGAILRRVDLLGAKLHRASLRRAVVEAWGMNRVLSFGADLTGAVVIRLEGELLGAVLRDATLVSTASLDLSGADLTGASIATPGATGCTWNSAPEIVTVDDEEVEVPPTVWPEGFQPSRLTDDRSDPEWFQGKRRRRVLLPSVRKRREQRERHASTPDGVPDSP
jgi:hypothetical protein